MSEAQPIAEALAPLAAEEQIRRAAECGQLEFHPLANAFPLIEGEEFAELVADVRAHGLNFPIVIHEQKILDGRNRYLAAKQAAAGLKFEFFGGGDPVRFVISANLHRRHLNATQRAYAMAELETLGHGGDRRSAEASAAAARADLARQGHVSERTIASAAIVRDHGAPELQAKVKAGVVAASTAAQLAALPAEQQAEIVARGEKEILAKAKEIQGARRKERRAERIANVARLALVDCPWPQQRFPLLYADPPWRYENPPMGDGDRSIENHYPTMTLDEICALPVHEHITDDCVLFLWMTAPQLFLATEPILRAWGDPHWADPARCRPDRWFVPHAQIIWDKEDIGLGYWVRNQHELLIIATRGDVPVPAEDARPRSVFRERVGRHSAKPDGIRNLIERMYPELEKLELFARGVPLDKHGQPRKRWHVWGNQAGEAYSEAAE